LQGIPRKSVEKVLGTPKVQTNNVSYYEYNKEDWPIVASFFADFLTMGATIFFASDAHQAQRETIGILYSPEDTVVGISFSEVEAQYRKWLQSENQDKELNDLCLTANLGYGPAQAVQGARYQYGLWNTKVDNKKAYLWFELAEFGGQKNAKKAITTLSKKLSSTEIAEINKQFSNWTPGSCDNELITGKDVHNSILSP
jgi:TPR repeat protein